MFKTEIEKATFKRDLNKLFLEIKEEVRIKFLRKKTGWRKHRRCNLRKEI
jgi:hypothetical protein